MSPKHFCHSKLGAGSGSPEPSDDLDEKEFQKNVRVTTINSVFSSSSKWIKCLYILYIKYTHQNRYPAASNIYLLHLFFKGDNNLYYNYNNYMYANNSYYV